MILGNGEFPGEFVTEVGRVDHGGVAGDGICNVFGALDENQLRSDQPHGVVKTAWPPNQVYVMFLASWAGELPYLLRIAARHACSCRGGHRSGGSGSDQPGF